MLFVKCGISDYYYMIGGLDCHTLEFYYLMNVADNEIKKCKKYADNGDELVWLTMDEIQYNEIKPTVIKERIFDISRAEYPIHIIEERDK